MSAAVQARIRALLADPARSIDALGSAARPGAETLKALDALSASARRLTDVNVALVPLIGRFRDPGPGRKWWRWFVGESLERDVRFANICAEIEALAAVGTEERGTARDLVEGLRREAATMDTELAALEIDLQAARTILAPAGARLRKVLPVAPDHWDRFARRAANLESIATALQLTRAQYDVAARHAETVVDRFEEIRLLLMPIWYQRMGFELFSDRVGADAMTDRPLDFHLG